MQNSDGIVLFWLLPSDVSEENLSDDIHSLKEIIDDIRIFYDRDQCVETLPSIIGQTIFLVLGHNQSDLAEILSTFTYLYYIYLSEPSHYSDRTQIRGVFPQVEQLLHQLKKDIKTAERSYTHLRLTEIGDLIQTQISMLDLNSREKEFTWIQSIFDVLLHTPRPSDNVYQDLLNECRLIYRGNNEQTKYIDEFENEYHPSKAIWWYTRPTFLYRLLNMALRTENMMIIWKFRFIIQDIYQQLKTMHDKQRDQPNRSEHHHSLTVYRGQFISLTELETLKSAVGGLIATTSFLSTSRDREVANAFAGDGVKPANLEAIMLEICIEQSGFEEEQRPVADISEVSSNGDEAEILLCMGTMMRVESVERNKEITRIRLHTCSYDDSTRKLPKTVLALFRSSILAYETCSLFALGVLLLNIREFKKSEQFFNMIKPSTHPVFDEMITLYLTWARIRQSNNSDISEALKLSRQYQRICQSILDHESIPNWLRKLIELSAQSEATLIDALKSIDIESLDEVWLREMFKKVRGNTLEFSTTSIHPSINKSVNLFSDMTKFSDGEMDSTVHEIWEFRNDLCENLLDPSQSDTLLNMASTAWSDGDYDRAIKLARDGLSITYDYRIKILLYKQLILCYKMQNNWTAVIESYQCIINMPEIPPSSSKIVEAHIECGDACMELDDFSEAFLSYTSALQLQNQHHVPNHPLISQIHIKIGKVFQKTGDLSGALENYEKATTCDSPDPDTKSEAYEKIGIIYVEFKNYNMARSNFTKCLEIRKDSTPRKTLLIALTHLWLARVEDKTERYQQRDFHIQQVRTIDIRDEQHRQSIMELISKLFGEIPPTSS